MSDETRSQTVDFPAGQKFERLARLGEQNASPERICAELARLFHVKPDEVALLKLEKGMLRFLFPPGLKTAGLIPLNGSAVAARTAATKSTLLSNSFAKMKHVRIFEEVKTGITHSENPERMPIQKLMSAPILDGESKVLGVVQISRKGYDAGSAGADFGSEELKLLEQAAALVADLEFIR
jgi:hypothetical protein